MSDNNRRLRERQRAKTAERVTRGAALIGMREVAEFAAAMSVGLGRNDGLHDAVDVDEFDAIVAKAREAAEVHASAYRRLAELEGRQAP